MNTGLPPLIELVNASVMRGDEVVLKDLNLRIEVGEHVAILGPNGIDAVMDMGRTAVAVVARWEGHNLGAPVEPTV